MDMRRQLCKRPQRRCLLRRDGELEGSKALRRGQCTAMGKPLGAVGVTEKVKATLDTNTLSEA